MPAAKDQLGCICSDKAFKLHHLVETLEPATMVSSAAPGLQQGLWQRFQLAASSGPAQATLGKLGHAMGRTLAAVRGAEGVHHEQPSQDAPHICCASSSYSSFSPCLKRNVLKQELPHLGCNLTPAR